MTPLRVVLDTNTVISAMCFNKSLARRAYEAVFDQPEIQAFCSAATLAELEEVFQREKFNRFVDPEDREAFFREYTHRLQVIEPTETIAACRDPKDDCFLELAVAADADLIISQDEDLLTLNPFREIEIIDAQTFCERLKLSDQ